MLYFFVFSYQEVCQCVYVYACVGVGVGGLRYHWLTEPEQGPIA